MKHLVIVLTEPVEGREAEFNDYYEIFHLEEVLATTGWTSAQRFKLSDQQGMACPLRYLRQRYTKSKPTIRNRCWQD